MGRLTENSIVNLKNKSHAMTGEIVVPDGGAEGVILSPRAVPSPGCALYAKDGKPVYCYNLFGLQLFKVVGDGQISRPASTRCAWSSATTGAVSARAATVSLFLDGARSAAARRGNVPMLFSADETTDVGSDTASPVCDDYGSASAISPAR